MTMRFSIRSRLYLRSNEQSRPVARELGPADVSVATPG